jgi:hypothetical protein
MKLLLKIFILVMGISMLSIIGLDYLLVYDYITHSFYKISCTILLVTMVVAVLVTYFSVLFFKDEL